MEVAKPDAEDEHTMVTLYLRVTKQLEIAQRLLREAVEVGEHAESCTIRRRYDWRCSCHYGRFCVEAKSVIQWGSV